MMENYETLVEAMQALREEGYVEDFNLKEFWLECHAGKTKVYHQDFQVDKLFRFEGMTDPGDENILYAISSPRLGIKGVLVNAYGIYENAVDADLMKKLKIVAS